MQMAILVQYQSRLHQQLAAMRLDQIDQLIDGSYRIAPKSIAGAPAALVLSAAGSSMPTLAKVDPTSDRQRWLLESP